MPSWVTAVLLGAARRRGEIYTFFFFSYFWLFWKHVKEKPLDRFLCMIHQNACFGVICIPFWVTSPSPNFCTVFCPQNCPNNAFQWEAPQTASERPVDGCSRLAAQTTQLGGINNISNGKSTQSHKTPYSPQNITYLAQCIFNGNKPMDTNAHSFQTARPIYFIFGRPLRGGKPL